MSTWTSDFKYTIPFTIAHKNGRLGLNLTVCYTVSIS